MEDYINLAARRWSALDSIVKLLSQGKALSKREKEIYEIAKRELNDDD